MAEALLWMFVVLGVPTGGVLLGLAIWALNTGREAQRRAETLEQEVAKLRRELFLRTDWLKNELARTQGEMARRTALPPPTPAVVAATEPAPEPATATEPATAAATESATATVTGAVAASAAESVAASDAAAEPVTEAAAAARAAGPVAPTAPPPAPAEQPSLEERIGLVWFTRIGAVILLLGVAYFFKYAVDNAWVGPAGRVGMGVLAGVGLLAFAELSGAATKRVFVHVLLGVGLSFLLFSVYASHAFYSLVPSPIALAGLFAVSLLGGALAVRHHGQAILILSLAAALAAPVLLSTGEDRPLALFSYVLLVTSLVSAVSVREAFAIAPWIGIVGAIALYTGWHATFWDVGPNGAYSSLTARVVPGAFVMLLSAQWLAVFVVARKRAVPRFGAFAYAVIAVVFLHLGATSLLHDEPITLGVVLSVLGAGSIALLRREKQEKLLALPMLVSFASLLGTFKGGREYPVMMMGALVVWAGVYLVGLLTPTKEHDEPGAGALLLTGVVGLAMLILGAGVLTHRTDEYQLFVLGLSALYAALSVIYGAAALGVVTMITSSVFLLASGKHAGALDVRFIAVSGGWAATYFGAGAFDLVGRRAPATAGRVLLPAMSSVLFVVLALVHTSNDDDLVRAGLLATVAALDIGLGAIVLRRGARRPATAMLALGLAALAAAVAFVLSGAAITVAWVALATVVVILAARERDPLWTAGGLALFAVAALRLLAFDLEGPERARDAWIQSYGVSGHLLPTLLLNERALALGAMAAGLLLAALAMRRSTEKWLVGLGAAVLFAGHAATLTLVVLEAKRALVGLPVPPGTFADHVAFERFLSSFREAEASGSTARGMVTTLVFGLYASLLVGLGFGGRSTPHRWLGLGLFALTLAKLGLWDIWNLSRVQQIFVFMGVGALLLAASFLYARFGKRLVTLLKDGAGPVAVFLLVSGAATREAHAFEPARFESSRLIEVPDRGLSVFALDADVWAATRSRVPLADLRIITADGVETPYVRRAAHGSPAAPTVIATIVDPVKMPEGGARAVLDLGRTGLRHSAVRLALSGAAFARKVRIESSADERDFRVLAEGAWVFRLASSAGAAESTLVAYPPSDARYLRVTILGGSDGSELAITGATAVLPSSAPPPRDDASLPLALIATTRDDSGRGTTFSFDLGRVSVPVEGLELDVVSAIFERRATVTAGYVREAREPVGGGVLFRVGSVAPASVVTREGRRLSTQQTRRRFFHVHVDDGDDAPLEVRGGRALWRPEEIAFLPDAAGHYALLIGDAESTVPSYDLERVLARAGGFEPRPIALGALVPNPRYRPPAPPEPKPVPFTEKHRTPILVAILAIVAVLGAWASVMLFRKGAHDTRPPGSLPSHVWRIVPFNAVARVVMSAAAARALSSAALTAGAMPGPGGSQPPCSTVRRRSAF